MRSLRYNLPMTTRSRRAGVSLLSLWIRSLAVLVLLAGAGVMEVRSQGTTLIIFDDDDATGADYRDASFGFADGGDVLRLAGPGQDKMPVEASQAFSGDDSGLLQWRHVAGGTWELFIAADGFEAKWVDYLAARRQDPGGATPPAVPTGVVTRAGDRSVILHWDPDTEIDLGGYFVYRATSAQGPFERRTVTPLEDNHFTDFTVENGQAYVYEVRAVNTVGQESAPSAAATATPHALDDDAFLDLVSHTAFDYFWYEANLANGLVKDRSTEASPASIAAVGFGLTAYGVGIERGWISPEAGRARVLSTLRFFWHSPHTAAPDATGYQGFYYHFLDMKTGQRAWNSELSTIDTALLLGGVLFAQQYFASDDPQDAEIRALADSIYRRVDWPWASPRPPAVSHGWRPETGFLAFDWRGYNEAMLLYVFALGSPTHPVDAAAWAAWTSTYSGQWQTHYGLSFLVFPPLFGHQYSHVWIDFRGIQDEYMRGRGIDYFENSRRATLANRAYCVDNPGGWKDYGENVWGLTASDCPNNGAGDACEGYGARGAPPPQNDDGTIAPTAAGGSLAFTPGESLAALRHMYDAYRTRLWGPYGFRDAFNPTQNWFDDDYLGIDQGPILLMIENHRSGFVWDVFMRHEAVRRGLERAGFEPVATATEPAGAAPLLILAPNTPNPFHDTTELRYAIQAPGDVTLAVYDLLGRRVASLVDGPRPAGVHALTWAPRGLASGVYVVRLETAGALRTRAVILTR